MLYQPSDEERTQEEHGNTPGFGRSEFRRDYGRLLHSPAFRRLQGKTQLFPGHESDFFRNRLTHSLEVAQIAKGIALFINNSDKAFSQNGIDTDLVEFAALAHDLGHPPFGHNGEKALDDCMKRYGGFEGNAQTLRLLSRIEKKVFAKSTEEDPTTTYCGISATGIDNRLGLNLTFRSLASVLKYDNEIPLTRGKRSELVKGYYNSEKNLVKKIKEHVGGPKNKKIPFKTVECQIMDLADDIAYSTYDLEDSMKGGFSHPLFLRSKIGINKSLIEKVHKKVKRGIPDATIKEVFQALENTFTLDSTSNEPNTPDALISFNQSILVASQGKLRVGFTSSLINEFMHGLRIKSYDSRDIIFSKIHLERATHLKIESLKHLNYELMIMSPRLKLVEYRGYDLVKSIFEALDSENGHLLLPEDWREMHLRIKDAPSQKRLICDFIAGMTDKYAIEFYERLKGSGATIFKPV